MKKPLKASKKPARKRRSTKRYTVTEINDMRVCIKRLNIVLGCGYDPRQLEATVEAQLQTHMLNGTSPAELRKAATDHAEADQKAYLEAVEDSYEPPNEEKEFRDYVKADLVAAGLDPALADAASMDDKTVEDIIERALGLPWWQRLMDSVFPPHDKSTIQQGDNT
jgi:hypothetical protein